MRAITAKDFADYYKIIPNAALHYRELFPNNYLNIGELADKDRIKTAKDQFANLLNSNSNEQSVLNFIRDNQYYFIIGAIFHCDLTPIHFRFGHHNAFLFKEFPLGTNHVADYLLVGKNSGGYEFIFIEFESPTGNVVTRDGEFGQVIRKGINQVGDWHRWLVANYPTLQSEFEKHLGVYDKNLPKEFYKLDESRLHYVVVAGRRADYKEKTYTLRRELFKNSNITLLHYDNVLDLIDRFDGCGNY